MHPSDWQLDMDLCHCLSQLCNIHCWLTLWPLCWLATVKTYAATSTILLFIYHVQFKKNENVVKILLPLTRAAPVVVIMKLYWIFVDGMNDFDFASKVSATCNIWYVSKMGGMTIVSNIYFVAFAEWTHQAYVIDGYRYIGAASIGFAIIVLSMV